MTLYITALTVKYLYTLLSCYIYWCTGKSSELNMPVLVLPNWSINLFSVLSFSDFMHVTNVQFSVATYGESPLCLDWSSLALGCFSVLGERTTVLWEQVPKFLESLFILHIAANYMQVYHIPMSWKPVQVQYDQHSTSSLYPNPAVGYGPSTPAPAEIMD